MLPLLSLIHLGFIINSKDMTLKLTEEKKNKKFMTIIPNLLKNQNPLFNLYHKSLATYLLASQLYN